MSGAPLVPPSLPQLMHENSDDREDGTNEPKKSVSEAVLDLGNAVFLHLKNSVEFPKR